MSPSGCGGDTLSPFSSAAAAAADTCMHAADTKGREGFMKIEIETPQKDMTLTVPNAEALKALLVHPKP